MKKTIAVLFAMGLGFGCGSEDDEVPIIIPTENNGNNNSTSNNATNNSNSNNTSGSIVAPRIGDGEAQFTEILDAQSVYQATDLEFNPEDDSQLWMVQRLPKSSDTCTQADPSGCAALIGYATIITNPGEENQTSERRQDPNSWHFLRRPPAMAFGALGTWATCGEERTGNYMDEAADFIGPSLWSSDLAIFAVPPGPGLNGSHLDMLHATPWCVGIAHEKDNIYWLFNGNVGSLDKYDFAEDHGVGQADHSDGMVYRYAVGELTRVPDVPSGMHFDSETSLLYVVDSGKKRVVALDTTSGTRGGPMSPIYEPLADNAMYNDADVSVIVAEGAGSMQTPSGMVYDDGILYITDNATAKIHAFDLDGEELSTLETPMAAGELSGITLGPDGKLYITSLVDSHVLRIDP